MRLSFFILLVLTTLSSTMAQKANKVSAKSKVKHIEFKQMVNMQGVKYLPLLQIENLEFKDANGNQILEAMENGFLSFTLINSGKGEATNIKLDIVNAKFSPGIDFESKESHGTIYPSQSNDIYVPISSTNLLEDGSAIIKITAEDANGVKSNTSLINLETTRFREPKIVVADAIFKTDKGGAVQLNTPVYINLLIQNVGEGDAENVMTEIILPDDCISLGKPLTNIGYLGKGQVYDLNYAFVPTTNYTNEKINIKINLSESYGKYAVNEELNVSLGQELLAANRKINTQAAALSGTTALATLRPEVDMNIPTNPVKISNRIALIIGNEDYHSRQSGNNTESDVQFDRNDAMIFREYSKNVLGIEENNIFFLTDATAAEMQENIDVVSKLASKMGSGTEIIFYYAGHGLPNENTKVPYLIPVDVSGMNLNSAIALRKVYSKFSESNAAKVTIFLDACFSGGGRNAGLLAARAIRVRPKEELLKGNIVVFAASSNEQVALPYNEKQHGMFTYHLLKKLQETKGEVTYNELFTYLERNVAIESLRINFKEQDPKVSVSDRVSDSWRDWSFIVPVEDIE